MVFVLMPDALGRVECGVLTAAQMETLAFAMDLPFSLVLVALVAYSVF